MNQIGRWQKRINQLNNSIEAAVERITREVDEDWDEKKMGIVPGDELIKMVANHYGVAFDKTRDDGVGLAKMMTKDEIDDEIATILKSIVE